MKSTTVGICFEFRDEEALEQSFNPTQGPVRISLVGSWEALDAVERSLVMGWMTRFIDHLNQGDPE